ncbi:hypothetical protein ACF1GY_37530 [Streptomyces sp. NPDC014684]|uniref:hypothetical protein n=1 Tax=Streptomyces sp. NPDC014684 TaxID=3364880 RepID=UPI0036F9DF20
MISSPIVVHRPSITGGRRVALHRQGRDEFLGLAHSDHDLAMFLESAGVADPVAIHAADPSAETLRVTAR